MYQTSTPSLKSTAALLVALISSAAPARAAPLPLMCILTSEEAPSIQIRLTERTAHSLKGTLIQNTTSLGVFQTGRPKRGLDPWWSLQDGNNIAKGSSVLFKEDDLWNPYRHLPKPAETNRVLFVGLAPELWNWVNEGNLIMLRNNRSLLRAAAGFWSISNQCAGGRLIKS